MTKEGTVDAPNRSPVELCAFITDLELAAMVDKNAGGPGCIFYESESESGSSGSRSSIGLSSNYVRRSVRICNSDDTDSNSDVDCVYIDRKIVKRKQKVEGESSSNFEDSQCDSRFSSCDTDSEGSSDSHTSSATSEETKSVVAPSGNNNDSSDCQEFKDN